MVIKTKFNVGDKVFTLDAKKVAITDFIISSLTVAVYDDRQSVYYYPKKEGVIGSSEMVEENRCFQTKEDLIEHLTRSYPNTEIERK